MTEPTREKFNSFELQMEVLTGCAFKCAGCFVNKNTDNKVSEKLYRVAEEFLEHLYPYTTVIGSTDVFTANNSTALLSDARFRELLMRFDRLVVNSTLARIEPRILELLASLEVVLQINMVVPESKYLNDRYLTAIARRLDEVKKVFPDLVLHPQLNLSEELLVENYEELNNLYMTYFGQGVDFNLSFARTHRDPETYVRHFDWLRKVTSTTRATVDGSLRNQHLDVVSRHDKLERAVIFYENKFYAIPIVYEDLIQIRERYRFDSYADYTRQFNQQVMEQYDYSVQTEECAACEFLPVCVERRVLAVMEDYGITHCIMPKATILRVNKWA